jgi:hypothetical protein
MWQKFRSWPWWAQVAVWVCLPAVVFSVWLWQRPWSLWWRLGLAGVAFLLWVPIVIAAAGSGDSSAKTNQPRAEASANTQATTSTSQVVETTTESVDYSALADEVLATQKKVLSTAGKLKHWNALPRNVRRAYNRLDGLLGTDATISADEHGDVTANLAVLKSAISSGRLHALVVEARAEARAKALARAEARAEKKAEAAAAAAAAAETTAQASNCDSNYSGCLDPNASDYDCSGGSGNGPKYTGPVQVLGYDHYGLDADGDGVGCEDS